MIENTFQVSFFSYRDEMPFYTSRKPMKWREYKPKYDPKFFMALIVETGNTKSGS